MTTSSLRLAKWLAEYAHLTPAASAIPSLHDST